MERRELGNKGEQIAVNYLEKKGYRILETNWYYNHKEIDIIAKFGEELIIVEVKTRTTNYFGEPYEFVDEKKQKFLIEAANGYLNEKNLDLPVRFDIISVLIKKYKTEIFHIENAFSP